GNILVVAMLITPAATARLFVQRFHSLMLLGSLIGALCGLSGLYASYYLNLASGGVIVLVATLVFGVAFVFAPRTGLLAGLVPGPCLGGVPDCGGAWWSGELWPKATDTIAAAVATLCRRHSLHDRHLQPISHAYLH